MIERVQEAGYTVLETMIGVVLLGIALTALFITTTRVEQTTQFSSERNDSLDQLRIMAANFTKDVRQGIDATAIAAVTKDSVSFDTYVGGVVKNVTWRVVAQGGTDRFERLVAGSTSAVYVVNLTTSAVFNFFDATTPSQVIKIGLDLATQPDLRHPPVAVSTVVEMRNVP